MAVIRHLLEKTKLFTIPEFEGAESAPTFAKHLNYQCGRILLFASLITTIAWLPYIPLDNRLHPDEPILILIRVGLSVISLTIFILHISRKYLECNLLFLNIIGAYLAVSSGLITALTKADPVYLGGHVFIMTLLAVVPVKRRDALLVLTASLIIFFLVGYFNGVSFKKVDAQYSLQNLFSATFVAVIFIYLLDRMRYASWMKSRKIEEQARELQSDKEKIDKLLLNILPPSVADELKERGRVTPVFYSSATIVFTDFVGFTKISEKLNPDQLVSALDQLFSRFDRVMDKYGLEKLKTIGDSYMYAGGVPLANDTHAIDAVLGAIEILSLVENANKEKTGQGRPVFEIRIGIHTGPLMAGVVGEKKFVYDVWGDSVNLASRMESSGEKGKINISEATYIRIKEFFETEGRGQIVAKNKGAVNMYFVLGIKAGLTEEEACLVPNAYFRNQYHNYQMSQENCRKA